MSDSKPLAHLPQNKKDMLLALTKKFNLDWPAATIITGDGAKRAIKRIDQQTDRIKNRPEVVNGFYADTRQNVTNSEAPAPTIKPEKVCPVKVGDEVKVFGDRGGQVYTVSDILNLSYGRSGFWAKLTYAGGNIKLPKPVECSRLVVVEKEHQLIQ